ncbi:hypothetical protein FHX82_001835 [Amycolatopsis bartoniae]|uniref:Uncharacterized protein n=1 Tax=Amycolatopsis bartoniae TaxID=941986 RepID=A0A8H9IXT9_9PSEU|nr:hypothetical protein [Amycolatopsis bartoniae]MBB2934815.1 hypothetical protein [Amycolatopsis bartoniae]TVT03059.1 hypothetical protein FNH07_26075 [Amycolatopsis bartoniae]GHF44572.1 hypothetical protein GCM10017566_16910 [Amycolatopsis bartoniae]
MWDQLKSLADIAPALSVSIALLALAVSVFGAITARRAYRISKAQEKRRLLPIDVYLVDSAAYPLDNGRQRYAFVLELYNPSENATSVASAELHIGFKENTLSYILKIPPDNDQNAPAQLAGNQERIMIPVRLNAGETVGGWISFTTPNESVEWHEIDSYKIQLTDTLRRTTSTQAILLTQRRIDSDQETK